MLPYIMYVHIWLFMETRLSNQYAIYVIQQVNFCGVLDCFKWHANIFRMFSFHIIGELYVITQINTLNVCIQNTIAECNVATVTSYCSVMQDVILRVTTSDMSRTIHCVSYTPQLKEFQSLENDVCHTVVFGNVATFVASPKMLHWMQMADRSNVF